MTEISREQIEQFEEDGYLLVKQVFSRDRIERIREYISQLGPEDSGSDFSHHHPLTDLLTDSNFVSVANRLLGGQPIYYGKSTIFRDAGKGVGGFHHDAKVDDDDRLTNTFPVVRFIVFLQDHSRHSGGIKFRRRSHRYKMVNAKGPVDYLKKVARITFKEKRRHEYRFLDFGGLSLSPKTQAENVPSEVGDVVAFNMRTYHCGRFVRMRGMPNRALDPFIERNLPISLSVPRERDRYALFITLARPFDRLDEYVAQRARGADRELLRGSAVDEPPFVRKLNDAGITVMPDGKYIAAGSHE